MGHLSRVLRRIIAIVRPGREEAMAHREIASHLSFLEEEYRRRGLSNAQARRAARLVLGGIEPTKERHRDARAFRWIEDLRRDACYAARMLQRYPIATAAGALSLARCRWRLASG